LPGVDWRVLDGSWTQWWDQVSLPRALARDAATVFLSPYYKGPLSAPCPVVLTIHDLFFIGYPGQRRPVYDATMTAMARLYAGRAAAIIADSEYSKRSIVARLGVRAAKVSVIPWPWVPSSRRRRRASPCWRAMPSRGPTSSTSGTSSRTRTSRG